VALLAESDMKVFADQGGQEEGGSGAGRRGKLARAAAQLLHARCRRAGCGRGQAPGADAGRSFQCSVAASSAPSVAHWSKSSCAAAA